MVEVRSVQNTDGRRLVLANNVPLLWYRRGCINRLVKEIALHRSGQFTYHAYFIAGDVYGFKACRNADGTITVHSYNDGYDKTTITCAEYGEMVAKIRREIGDAQRSVSS